MKTKLAKGPFNEDDLEDAYEHSIANQDEVDVSRRCGCFNCGAVFSPEEIVEWIDDAEGQTAICPRCDVDAVLGEASGYPLTKEFLDEMRRRWL